MCTLSWRCDEVSLDVFFNRDEQKVRPTARRAQFWQDYQAIFPVDPQGGGTWIAVTREGVVFALLNNYAETAEILAHRRVVGGNSQIWLSRGLVITMLLQELSANETDRSCSHAGQFLDDLLQEYVEQLPLYSFLPFTLVCIRPGEVARACHWDGLQLQFENVVSPLVSSGVLLPQVKQSRLHYYPRINQTCDALRQFHRSHCPEPSALSVCMHRQDAQTVSLTHIHVGKDIRFSYLAGAPCQSENEVVVTLARKSFNEFAKNNFSCL